jgi:hypothetical protein
LSGVPADRPAIPAPSVGAAFRTGMTHPGLGRLILAALGVVCVAARAAPPGLAPCVWHVRLDYHYSDAGAAGESDKRVLLALEAPMRCAGSGMETIAIPDGPVLATGRARVHRDVPHPDGATTERDIIDSEAAWPAPHDGADAAPGVEAPAPSFVGEGFGTKVIIAAALSGTERRALRAAPPAPATQGARGLTTAIEPEGDPNRLQLELFLDPAPGTPSDPSGALARVPERTREALAAPGGEAALALKGHLFGAQTQITGEGDFSIFYQRTLELSPARLAVDYCGWLTRGAHDWKPACLKSDSPPLP